MKLSVSHPSITMIRFEVNGSVIPYFQSNKEFTVNIDQSSTIDIFFEPWKIKPLVRIDNHLLDYWLADISQFDHTIQLQWDGEFYQRYQKRIIDSKINYLKIDKQEDIDYYLGIHNSNNDIVNEIKKYL